MPLDDASIHIRTFRELMDNWNVRALEQLFSGLLAVGPKNGPLEQFSKPGAA